MKRKLLFATFLLMLAVSFAPARQDDCIVTIHSQQVVGNCIVTEYDICCPGSKCVRTTTTECY